MQLPSDDIAMGLKRRNPEARSNLKRGDEGKEGERDVQDSLKSANRGRGKKKKSFACKITLYTICMSISGDMLQYMPDCFPYI